MCPTHRSELTTQERINLRVGVGSSNLVERLITRAAVSTVQGQNIKGQAHKVTSRILKKTR